MTVTRHKLASFFFYGAAVVLFNEISLIDIYPRLLSESKAKETCVLLFFGLPKKFKEIVHPSIVKNILDYNPTCDIYAHTYNKTEITTKRNGENQVPLSVNEIKMLTDNVFLEEEDVFYEKRDVEYYRNFFPQKKGWIYPESIDNMMKQWHSIESVWNSMEQARKETGKTYDRVGIFRSDLKYENPIDIQVEEEATVPDFGVPNSWMNDRLFYGTYLNGKRWAAERFSSVPEFIETDYYKTHGLHSETFVHWLLKDMNVTKSHVCAERVRANGLVKQDCWCPGTGGKNCPWWNAILKDMGTSEERRAQVDNAVYAEGTPSLPYY